MRHIAYLHDVVALLRGHIGQPAVRLEGRGVVAISAREFLPGFLFEQFQLRIEGTTQPSAQDLEGQTLSLGGVDLVVPGMLGLDDPVNHAGDWDNLRIRGAGILVRPLDGR